MELLDLKKRYAELYKPSTKAPVLLKVPPLRFLMIDGEGDAGGPSFQTAMGALYALAYPVKFAAKKQLALSYPVMPSEGLYWDAQAGMTTPPASPASASWRLMILLPDKVESEFVDQVRAKVATKKDIPLLSEIRVQTYTEGPAVHILHRGPYADESPTVRVLESFAEDHGLQLSGPHHEVYLNDPGRTAPDKLKTVVRYPVRPLTSH